MLRGYKLNTHIIICMNIALSLHVVPALKLLELTVIYYYIQLNKYTHVHVYNTCTYMFIQQVHLLYLP